MLIWIQRLVMLSRRRLISWILLSIMHTAVMSAIVACDRTGGGKIKPKSKSFTSVDRVTPSGFERKLTGDDKNNCLQLPELRAVFDEDEANSTVRIHTFDVGVVTNLTKTGIHTQEQRLQNIESELQIILCQQKPPFTMLSLTGSQVVRSLPYDLLEVREQEGCETVSFGPSATDGTEYKIIKHVPSAMFLQSTGETKEYLFYQVLHRQKRVRITRFFPADGVPGKKPNKPYFFEQYEIGVGEALLGRVAIDAHLAKLLTAAVVEPDDWTKTESAPVAVRDGDGSGESATEALPPALPTKKKVTPESEKDQNSGNPRTDRPMVLLAPSTLEIVFHLMTERNFEAPPKCE